MRLNGQLQSNQLNNEQLESIKSERLVKSKESEDAEKPDNKSGAKVINQSGNDKADNEDQTNLVSFQILSSNFKVLLNSSRL